MTTVRLHRYIEPQLEGAVADLLARIERATGRPALSDHLRLDLADGGGDGFLAATLTDPASTGIVGYAQASAANDNHALELALDPTRADEIEADGGALVAAAVDAIGAAGGGSVNWWVLDPRPEHERISAVHGMTTARTLFEMRRRLPMPETAAIETRSFVIGADEVAWLDVNNRAFADHGEQGGWSIDTLRRRQGEDWFDADGFRIHEREGRLAGFCWTKEHEPTATDPRLGEIYVIAVHPDFHGQGLGRQMTLAGLDHITSRGITTAMLWVDAGNHAAINLYEQLGFAVETTKVAFTLDVLSSVASA